MKFSNRIIEQIILGKDLERERRIKERKSYRMRDPSAIAQMDSNKVSLKHWH